MNSRGLLDNNKPLSMSPYLSEFRPGLSQKRTPSIHVHVDGEQGPSDLDVVHTSLQIFSSLLQRSRAGQVSQCLNATFDYMDKDSVWKDHELCAWIIESVTEWTQYQYRFAVPTKIVQRVMAMQDSSEVSSLLGLIRMLNNVLSSRTALNNISTSDVITQLITVMMRRTAQNPADSLLEELACCISATGTHIYYADQIQDLANELISKLVNVQIYGPLGANRRSSEESRIKALALLLKSLKGLMEVAGGHEFRSKSVSRKESRQTRSASLLQGEGDLPSNIPEVLHKEKQHQRSRIDPEVN
jgi:protein EFR3